MTILNQNQIITIQTMIATAFQSVKSHKCNSTATSRRLVEFNVGKALGAYSMIGEDCPSDHIHARMQSLMDEYVSCSLVGPN
jgi:hypothetical protein